MLFRLPSARVRTAVCQTLSSVSAVDDSGSAQKMPGLSVLHACCHCHASKTACSDFRPCHRCVRLGLTCSSNLDQPRKRACMSCHSGKVACEFIESDTCNR